MRSEERRVANFQYFCLKGIQGKSPKNRLVSLTSTQANDLETITKASISNCMDTQGMISASMNLLYTNHI